MLDLGWSELLIIGVVALIVVGPKDLPKMLRALGQYAGRAKGIAREFQRSMDEAARQADIEELHEVKKDLDEMRDAQHKMQRDLGQSFLDGPKKPDSKKTDSKKVAAKKAGDRAAVESKKADAEPARVDDATPEPAKTPAKKSPKKISEPRAEPGSVSGA